MLTRKGFFAALVSTLGGALASRSTDGAISNGDREPDRESPLMSAGDSVSSVRILAAAGDGQTDDHAAFQMGEGTGKRGFVPPGSYFIGSDLTLSTGWVFAEGARLKPGHGVTVTFTGPCEAGPHQIFDSRAGGRIVFLAGAVRHALPQWWGAAGDGETDDRAALAAADAACDACLLTGGSFRIAAELKLMRRWQIAAGARFVVASGGALMIDGRLEGGPQQIFEVDGGTLLLGDRVAERILPEWFGAVADGVTDSSSAIQRAIDSRGSDLVLHFGSSGVYVVDAQINLAGSNVRITGEPAILKRSEASGSARMFRFSGSTAASNIEIDHLRFISERSSRNTDAGVIDLADGDRDIAGIHIHDCDFDFSASDGSMAILVAVSSQTTIQNILVERCGFKNIKYGSIGVNNSFAQSHLIEGVRIEGNTFTSGGAFPITVAGPIKGVSIRGNRIVGSGGTYGIEIVGPSGCIVDGNIFSGSLKNIISSTGAEVNPVGNGIIISNNSTDGKVTGGFELQNMDGAILTGNYFEITGLLVFSGVGNGCRATLDGNWIKSDASRTGVSMIAGADVYLVPGSNRFGSNRPIDNPKRLFLTTPPGGDARSTVTFHLGAEPSWTPAAVRIRVNQVMPDGGFGGMAEALVAFRYVDGVPAVQISRTDTVTHPNLTLDMSYATRVVAITARGPDAGVQQSWLLDWDVRSLESITSAVS